MSIEVLKQIWPEWKIEEQPLGKGSFGVVYKAVHKEYNIEDCAAIKVISIPVDASLIDSLKSEGLSVNATRNYLKGLVDDFVSEIQHMVLLKGIQNIVNVENFKVVERKNELGWDIYIRMELLTSLDRFSCDKNLTEAELIKMGTDICSALEACEKCDIIHRDIKPANIFIHEFGHYKLGDFGVARKLEGMNGGLSQNRGTPDYMAPEVANGTKYDNRCDIYSLGMVLYRYLNKNRPPFISTEKQLVSYHERTDAYMRRIQGEQIPAPCKASPAMADLVLRACAYDPNMRFSTAKEMKKALAAVADGTYQITNSHSEQTTSSGRVASKYDGTTAVRKPFSDSGTKTLTKNVLADRDKTTAVRKVPGTSAHSTTYVVNTFGAPQKRSVFEGIKSLFPNKPRKEKGQGMNKKIRAAERDISGQMQYEMGRAYYEGKNCERNYEQAIRWFLESAKYDYLPAMRAVANCYYYGHGVEVDYTKAVLYYTIAHEAGDAEASYCLGQCYEKGVGTNKDLKKAAQCYSAAAEKDHAVAQRHLAGWYESSGYGVTHDAKKAFTLYQKAAELGDTKAMLKMAEYYMYGQFVKQDRTKYQEWCYRAVELGDTEAMCELASSMAPCFSIEKEYATSIYEVEARCREAIRLWKLAITYGCDEAKEKLNEIHEQLTVEYNQFDNWNYHDMAAKLLDVLSEK